MSGPAAAKAAAVFDSFDKDKTGWLPVDKAEDLLDGLGEGFHGPEMEDQIALMDPSKSGKLQKAAFVAWYVQLQDGGKPKKGDDADASSLDSDDRAEREEEREKARQSFVAMATTEGDDKGPYIAASDFPQLIESMNTTYCEEEHAKTVQRLKQADNDRIYLNDFLDWYVGWLFGGDESDDEEDEKEQETEKQAAAPAVTTGWGSAFAPKAGSWQCRVCMVTNDDPDATRCAACETPRTGENAADVAKKEGTAAAAATPSPTSGASIGAGGFSFGGGAATKKDEKASGGGTGGSIGAGGFSFGGGISSGGFSFGGPAAAAAATEPPSTASASSGGFLFQASKTSETTKESDGGKAATAGDSAFRADEIDLSSSEAKKAAQVFDSIDDANNRLSSLCKNGRFARRTGRGTAW